MDTLENLGLKRSTQMGSAIMGQPLNNTGDTRLRSIVKGIVWRTLATLATIILVYAFTRKLTLACEVGALEVVVKLALYYLHERSWNLIRWGKVPTETQATE